MSEAWNRGMRDASSRTPLHGGALSDPANGGGARRPRHIPPGSATPQTIRRSTATLKSARPMTWRPTGGWPRSPNTTAASIPACWSPPRLQILQSENPDRLMQWVSNLLARDDLHIVAVSPAAVCALRESDSMNNPLLTPHYTITVIDQDRLPEAAPADRWATSWTPLGA